MVPCRILLAGVLLAMLVMMMMSGAWPNFQEMRTSLRDNPMLTRSLFFFGDQANGENLVEHWFPHDGMERRFVEHLPENFAAGNPLLLVLHGGESTMYGNFESGGIRPGAFAARPWTALSNQHGFLLLSPNAHSTGGGWLLQEGGWWNDGRQPGAGAHVPTSTADDVGFLSQLIEWAIAERGIDPQRVYVAGGSNGGMMTYRLLRERPDLVAAGAAFVANLPENLATKAVEQPRPIFIMQGSADTSMPFSGGMIIFDQGLVTSSSVTRDFFVQANGAGPKNATRTVTDDNSPCRIDLDLYPSGTAPVAYYVMENAGHVIARRNRKFFLIEWFYRFALGPSCLGTNGGALAWEFLSQFSLEQE